MNYYFINISVCKFLSPGVNISFYPPTHSVFTMEAKIDGYTGNLSRTLS